MTLTRMAFFKLLLLVVILFAFASSTSSQEKQLDWNDLTITGSSSLRFSMPSGVILECKTAGKEPEDYYDCRLAGTLDGLVRFWMRQQRIQQQQWQQERESILREWKRSLPKPIKHDGKGRS